MLTPRQNAFVDHYVTCRNGAEAARRAGYAEPSARITASRLLTKDNIKTALAAAKADLKRKLNIDKKHVVVELLESVNVARQQLKPGEMIRGWVEIAKMLGHYTPEIVKVAVSAENAALRANYEALSNEELIAIAEGRHQPLF